MLGDAQQNAKYIAKDICLITWSQRGQSAQWTLTFWPSTRAKVTNLLAVAADFRGTTVGGGGTCSVPPPLRACRVSSATRPRNGRSTTRSSSQALHRHDSGSAWARAC
ncbi:uncharacterized protein PG986_010973 [Apiospora aurea]|uniref:Uncharacterized protein n=1 Tax=Apiospora aurea TaxID=335848 RepID=A0ABR1Q3S2_9PEZI